MEGEALPRGLNAVASLHVNQEQQILLLLHGFYMKVCKFTTPFMVFSVMYSICEGSKLDA